MQCILTRVDFGKYDISDQYSHLANCEWSACLACEHIDCVNLNHKCCLSVSVIFVAVIIGV